MSALTGFTKDNNLSQRCLDNTGQRMYYIVDFDQMPDKDEQASLISYLSLYAPLVMVVNTGGKSLHAWFRVSGAPEQETEDFIKRTLSLGADKAMKRPCQFCRMPDANRENGNRQGVIYFDEAECI
jgi:hypothetical protein